MFDIRDILKAGVCSFCDNIYEYNTLDKEDFIKEFKFYILENDLQSCIEYSTAEVAYDIENIENIYQENKDKNVKYELGEELFDKSERAFRKTIEEDKTINIKAFVENLKQEILQDLR